jgi:type II secretory pathway predicted ATPase ExeA
VWLRHWGLERDPFLGIRSPYVSLPSHDEAVSRLVYSIERGHRLTTFFAEAGLGKTTVVRKALAETRDPRRRTILVHTPSDGQELLSLLADGLGAGFDRGARCHGAWRGLARSMRSASLEGTQVVFVVDGWDEAMDCTTMRDLSAILEIGSRGGTPTSMIRVGRGPFDSMAEAMGSWSLTIDLERLTRSQAETYLETKLEAAGCRERIFTPRAVTRLQSWSGGVPGSLEQLAVWTLMAGAAQGLEVVSPDLVDVVASRSVEGTKLDPVVR